MNREFDAVVIGAGHNGLVAANYLASAGLRVGVFERRHLVGGCITTEELIPNTPGFKINGGAIDHILIQRTPIIEDLKLSEYGLKYISIEPMFEVPFPESQGGPLRFYSALDKTVQEFARYSKRDSESYSRLCDEWMKEEALLEALMLDAPPKMDVLFGVRGIGTLLRNRSLLSAMPQASRVDFNVMVRTVLMSANQLINENFEDERVRVSLAALFSLIFSTMSPSLPGTGLMAIMHTMLYRTGLKRPLGGSGRLSESLKDSLLAKGGKVFLTSEVRRILVEGGRTAGVELADGSKVGAPVVVGALDPQVALTKLLEPDLLPDSIVRKLESLRITSYGMTMHAALHAVPSELREGAISRPGRSAGKLLAPSSLSEVERAYHTANFSGRLSDSPLVAVNFPTTYDPSLAPMGKHVLYCWAQFVPDRSPMTWEKDYAKFKEDSKNKIMSRLTQTWTDIPELVIDTLVETPGDLEQRLWIQRGNTQHIDPTLEQMYYYRPIPELSHYRTPIRGLYITGAGTHPGGGVSGMPGYNCARVILADFKR